MILRITAAQYPSVLQRGDSMNSVLAYFDPSAGSLLLQALVGGFGGIAVFGRYLWIQFLGSSPTAGALTRSQEIKVPASNRLR
jgi:hypothetical protein